MPTGIDAGEEYLELARLWIDGFDGPVAVIEGDELDEGTGGEAGRELIVEVGVVDGQDVARRGYFLAVAHCVIASSLKGWVGHLWTEGVR